MKHVKNNIASLNRQNIDNLINKLETKEKRNSIQRPQSIRKMTHIALQNAQKENFERIKIMKQNKRFEKIEKLRMLKSKSKEVIELRDLKTEFDILEQEKEKLQERVIQTLKPKKKIKKIKENEDNIIVVKEMNKEIPEKKELKFWITEDSKK